MSTPIEEITKMVGRPLIYRDKEITITNLVERDGLVYMDYTEKGGPAGRFEKPVDKLEHFVLLLSEVKTEVKDQGIEISTQSDTEKPVPARKTSYESPMLAEHRTLLNDMRDMLVADMKTVRENKEYIPQAKQACNTANAIINLARLELSIRKDS